MSLRRTRKEEFPANGRAVDNFELDTPLIVKDVDFYRNPIANFLANFVSVIFWIVYWIAQTIIYGTAVTIIITFICPRYARYLLNHMMGQYEIENKFRDEL